VLAAASIPSGDEAPAKPSLLLTPERRAPVALTDQRAIAGRARGVRLSNVTAMQRPHISGVQPVQVPRRSLVAAACMRAERPEKARGGVWAALAAGDATRETRESAGLPRMARPGLEPGTPRYSVVGRNRSNKVESPAIPRVLLRHGRREEVRNFHTFLADSGTETHLVPKRLPRPTLNMRWSQGDRRSAANVVELSARKQPDRCTP